VPIINYHDLDELKNKNEEKVWKAIERHLNENPELCRCRDCILDAAALSLNNLPARYMVYSFHSNQPEEKEPGPEVDEAVKQAFEQVTRRPHHF
jgi:competence protein ComFB